MHQTCVVRVHILHVLLLWLLQAHRKSLQMLAIVFAQACPMNLHMNREIFPYRQAHYL